MLLEKPAVSHLRMGSGTFIDSSVTPEEKAIQEEYVKTQSAIKQYPKPHSANATGATKTYSAEVKPETRPLSLGTQNTQS